MVKALYYRHYTRWTKSGNVPDREVAACELKFVSHDHSEIASSIIAGIEKTLKHYKYRISNEGSNQLYLNMVRPSNFNWHCHNHDSLILDEKICRELEQLNNNSVIRAEIDNLKKSSLYYKFIHSRFYSALCSELDDFFSSERGYAYDGTCVIISDITDGSLSKPVFAGSSGKEVFSLVLNTDIQDLDPDNHSYITLVFPHDTFRALSKEETSMLAICLAERYPSYFKIVWAANELYKWIPGTIRSGHTQFYLDLGLDVKYKSRYISKDNTSSPQIKDIY